MSAMREGATGMTTLTASSSLNKMTRDSSPNEDVLTESPDHQSHLTPGDQLSTTSAPSPTGYRDYKPPAELLNSGYHSSPRRDNTREETETHKTILLGDSGVGKTSLLVQFDTGTFQTGNFAATVGIGFTVMLLGDSGVGKTCLLTRFRHGRFLSGNHISTVGIDFRNKVVTVGDTRIKLQIWDTAGQERFRSVTHAYYRDAHGNKADCGPERMVKKEDGKRLADEYDVPFMETSARTGANVELAFLAIAKQLKARKNADLDDTKFNVQDYVREQTKKSTCFMTNCQTT
ncbi:ras-related protein Rab-37 isoform X5 [Diachasmimorpha longicaudata]|uniref:ras-related protein Rab-37 isoform X5 n=1 Tax=Diachasmimorpha longicaudata TaxID=58733 RepID=UPI0030B8F92F